MAQVAEMYWLAEAEKPNVGICLIDQSGTIFFFEPSLCELLQLNDVDLLGQNFSLLFKHLAQISRESHVTELDLESALYHIEQHPIFYLPVRNQPQKRYAIRLFLLNTSINTNDGWGILVRDISVEWRNITQQFDPLFDIVSELRTFQANTRGMLSTLATGYDIWEPEMRHNFLEVLEDTFKEMERRLDHAQQVIALTLGPLQLNFRPLDFKRHIEQILRSIFVRMSGRKFVVNIPEDLPLVEVDHIRMNQVIYYLFDFAIHHSPSHGSIEISATSTEYAMFITVVSDSVRVSNEQIARSLNQPNHIHIEGREKVSTDCLELYLARQLVYAQGGQIWAEQVHGGATKICVEMPLKAFAYKPDYLLSQSAAAQEKMPELLQGRKGGKVLVAEDDRHMAGMLKEMLQLEGYQVLVASSGKATLESVKKHHPDLVLLDFFLPDMDGMELCASLRELTTVPILMVTGNDRVEDEAAAFYSGVDDYIKKPFKTQELLARVYAHLKRVDRQEPAPKIEEIKLGELHIDFRVHHVSIRGKRIKLSAREYKIVALLAQHAGHILSNEQILEKVWGMDYAGEPQHLWVYISRLRRKLEANPASPEYILTEPGSGYYMNTGAH